MKARMKFVAVAALLVRTLAVGAVAQDRRDLRCAQTTSDARFGHVHALHDLRRRERAWTAGW